MRIYYKNLKGMRFGKWTVLETFSKNNKGMTICQCDCGAIKTVDAYSLTHNGTKSCGKCNRIIMEDDHMKCITSNGLSFLFSCEDIEKVQKYTWHISNGYVTALIDGRTVYLHKFLLDADKGTEVDHINQNKLDNRRCNLRKVSHTQNQWNKGVRQDSSTGYKGVCYDKRSKSYVAYINANGIREYLGYYKTANEAAEAYNNASRRLHGEYRCENIV